MKRSKLASVCAGLLALVGIAFPTSINGVINWNLGLALRILVLLLAAALFIAAPSWKRFLANNVYICPALLFFTLLSPLPERAYGLFALYAAVTLVLSVDYAAVSRSAMFTFTWQVINYGSLILAAAIVFHVDAANNFIIANYSAFYPWLVVTSVAAGKPVLTFGSHSIAGFFFAAFCGLNYIRARATGAILPALAAGLHLVACAALRSVTGYMVIVGFAVLFFVDIRGRWLPLCLIVLGSLLPGLILLGRLPLQASLDAASTTLSSEGNGFRGRYTSYGRAGPMLDYIVRNPWRPSGVAYTEDVWVGDVGFIEYWFRGSVVLLVLMYRGLWLAVRAAVPGRSARLLVFALFLMFELGYTALIYPRMMGFMPLFFIVCRRWQIKQRPGVLRWRARSAGEAERTKGPRTVPCLP